MRPLIPLAAEAASPVVIPRVMLRTESVWFIKRINNATFEAIHASAMPAMQKVSFRRRHILPRMRLSTAVAARRCPTADHADLGSNRSRRNPSDRDRLGRQEGNDLSQDSARPEERQHYPPQGKGPA